MWCFNSRSFDLNSLSWTDCHQASNSVFQTNGTAIATFNPPVVDSVAETQTFCCLLKITLVLQLD